MIRVFHKHTEVGNIGIIDILNLYIFAALFVYIILVNVKLEIKLYKKITFQCHTLHLMGELKRSWLCWHSCSAESL